MASLAAAKKEVARKELVPSMLMSMALSTKDEPQYKVLRAACTDVSVDTLDKIKDLEKLEVSGVVTKASKDIRTVAATFRPDADFLLSASLVLCLQQSKSETLSSDARIALCVVIDALQKYDRASVLSARAGFDKCNQLHGAHLPIAL